MRLERIVVGMDFSRPALTAARWTAERLAPGAELALVHSVDLPRVPEFLREILPPDEAVVRRARDEAEHTMQELSRSLEPARPRTEIREGRASAQVARAAEEWGADLIVVGDRGHQRALRTLLGSTAERLVRCSPVPVLVARGLPDTVPRRILAPIGETEVTDDALRRVRVLRDRFRADVTALHVLSSGLYGAYRMVRSEAEAREVEKRAEAAATAWIEARLRSVELAEGDVAVEIAYGEPGFEVVDAAGRTGAELIVMGSRERRTRRAPFLGGVADAVLHGSSLPVLIVTGPSRG